MIDKEKLITKLIGNSLSLKTSDDGYITVAELNTTNEHGAEETIDKNTAIISPNLINKIKASHVNPFVNRTGVNYSKDFIYSPSFWLYLSKQSGLKKVEPLVVSWDSGNHTTLNIDQGFLSTFQLSPRLLSDKIYWDDLSKPQYEVVRNKPLSEYKFPTHSEAYVKIKKDYLKDYLYLRKKVAVQVFTVKKEIILDEDILELLNGKDFYIEEYERYQIRIRKYNHKKNTANIEINGYNVIFENDKDSETKQEIITGHNWKGIEGLVTEWRARHEMPFEYIYVSDEVLSKYESDEDYQVYPKSGSVSYGNQWSISYCERIGKNAIKIEIKKLYEGNSYEVIDYWNKFSIHPSEVIDGENIAKKAERLTKRYFLFGRLFYKLINHFFSFDFSASDIITIDEERIEYTGWSDFFDYKPITHYVNLKSFSREQFISRCKKLYVLFGENLKEKSLRKIVDHLGFSKTETKDYRSLRLLELIIKYLYVSQTTGLDPAANKEAIVERIKEFNEFKVLSSLLALNSIRQLDAHKSGDSKSKFHAALKDLSIEPNAISNNYASACEQVYDHLNELFINLNIFLSEAYDLNQQ